METISFAHGWNPSPESLTSGGTFVQTDQAALEPAVAIEPGLTWQKSLLPCIPPAVMLMTLQGGLPALAATLAHGMQTPEVANLQAQLADLGYFQDHHTGYFGDRTEAAVREFQEASGLVVDGIVGDQTRAALQSSATPIAAPEFSAPEYTEFEGFEGFATLDSVAIEGAEVQDIQTRLQNLGYNPGPIDGIFGPQTEAAIRDFQAARGLIVDGIVGPQTRSALEQSVTESQGLSFETLPKMEEVVFSDLGDLGAEYEILPVPELPL